MILYIFLMILSKALFLYLVPGLIFRSLILDILNDDGDTM